MLFIHQCKQARALFQCIGDSSFESVVCCVRSRTITRPNCALDKRTILCLYVPDFQRQVLKHVKILSERSKECKDQKKNKESFLLAESAHNAQNAQFGLVMTHPKNFEKLDLKKIFNFLVYGKMLVVQFLCMKNN